MLAMVVLVIPKQNACHRALASAVASVWEILPLNIPRTFLRTHRSSLTSQLIRQALPHPTLENSPPHPVILLFVALTLP